MYTHLISQGLQCVPDGHENSSHDSFNEWYLRLNRILHLISVAYGAGIQCSSSSGGSCCQPFWHRSWRGRKTARVGVAPFFQKFNAFDFYQLMQVHEVLTQKTMKVGAQKSIWHVRNIMTWSGLWAQTDCTVYSFHSNLFFLFRTVMWQFSQSFGSKRWKLRIHLLL